MDYIEFKKERNFGDKLNVTFDFLSKNFKPLFTAALYIAGPFILISSMGSLMYLQDITNLITSFEQEITNFGIDFFVSAFIAIVFTLIASLVLYVTVLEYINLYQEKKSSDISVKEVWGRVKGSIGTVIAGNFLVGLTFGAFIFIIAMIGGAAATASGFIAFLVIAVLLIATIYVLIVISIYNNNMVNDKKSIVESIQRCFYLVSGKWWSTFGLLIILSIIVGAAGGLLQLPVAAFQIADIFTATIEQDQDALLNVYKQTPLEMAYTGFTLIIRSLLNVVVIVGLTFQFYNLKERKDATGLFSEIESISDDNNSPGSLKSGDSEENETY